METTVYDPFFGTVFKNLRSHLSTLETERFQTAPLLKPFSKASVSISIFARFGVDDSWKPIKKYARLQAVTLFLKNSVGKNAKQVSLRAWLWAWRASGDVVSH